MVNWDEYVKLLKPCHQCLSKDHLDIMSVGVRGCQHILICHYCDFDVTTRYITHPQAENDLKAKWNAIFEIRTTKLQKYLTGEIGDR
jgi:hypothetical protein